MVATATGPIAARPTLYKGIRMRSRLEADYAAELDRQHQRWEYEPECFAGQHGQWLPDFGSDFGSEGPYAIFTEVKPAGPLQQFIPGSIPWLEHIDNILRRMEVAWESRPDAMLSLMFWEYGGHRHLHVLSMEKGRQWNIEHPSENRTSHWAGMGQYAPPRGA